MNTGFFEEICFPFHPATGDKFDRIFIGAFSLFLPGIDSKEKFIQQKLNPLHNHNKK